VVHELDHNDLRGRTLDEIDNRVEWIPGWGRDRIRNMMSARPDWCLSRQRVWGVPIPALIDRDSGKAVLDPARNRQAHRGGCKNGTDGLVGNAGGDVSARRPDQL